MLPPPPVPAPPEGAVDALGLTDPSGVGGEEADALDVVGAGLDGAGGVGLVGVGVGVGDGRQVQVGVGVGVGVWQVHVGVGDGVGVWHLHVGVGVGVPLGAPPACSLRLATFRLAAETPT
jgi:hypothetical protein